MKYSVYIVLIIIISSTLSNRIKKGPNEGDTQKKIKKEENPTQAPHGTIFI